MDMDAELEQFKKKNAPSLVGFSLRDSSDNVPTLSSLSMSSTTPSAIFKNTESTVDLVSVDEARDGGALITDDYEEQLIDILDNSGHLKDNAIPDVVKMKGKETPNPPLTTSELHKFDNEDHVEDSHKVSILGGDAEEYIAPASGANSNFKYQLKKKKGGKDLTEEENHEIIEPDNVRSVNDIIDYVDKGEFEKASTLVDDRIAQTICPPAKELDITDIKDPEVPDYAIETDSDYTAPAAMREGSESVLKELQDSRSSSRRPPLSTQTSYGDRPNLARGDSMHSGLNGDLMISKSFDHSSNSLVSERKPRHDPSGSRVTNASSLNYLRSISRSRSRVANDRKSFSTDSRLESTDLRENGALINDDEMSNASDIGYAVNKALDFVEDTHTIQHGQKISDSGDIVKHLQQGLAEVAEEEEASNRTSMNASDLLDQLANSAKELMIDEDDDIVEEDEENDEGVTTGETKEVVKNDEITKAHAVEKDDEIVESHEVAKDDESVKTHAVEKEDEVVKAHEVEKDEENVNIEDEAKDLNIVEADNNDVAEEDKAETEKSDDLEEIIAPQDGELKEEKAHFESKEINEECHLEAPSALEEKESEDATKSLEGEPVENNESEAAEPAEAVTENETNEEAESVKVESQEDDVETALSGEAEDLPAEKNTLDADADQKESEEEPAENENDEDDINAIIAAAAREQALKGSNADIGKDGSVFVPKNDKMTFEDEPVYLYTSFAGGFHVSTRTNRLVTILTANRIKFTYRDLGTDDEAKKVWRRYSAGKTLPGIVRGADDYIGNWEDIEEANEDYRVRSLIYETI